jgi:hypothetical protein
MYILAEHDITVTCDPADKARAKKPWELAFETFTSSLVVIKYAALPVPVHLIKAYFPSTSQIIYFV